MAEDEPNAARRRTGTRWGRRIASLVATLVAGGLLGGVATYINNQDTINASRDSETREYERSALAAQFFAFQDADTELDRLAIAYDNTVRGACADSGAGPLPCSSDPDSAPPRPPLLLPLPECPAEVSIRSVVSTSNGFQDRAIEDAVKKYDVELVALDNLLHRVATAGADIERIATTIDSAHHHIQDAIHHKDAKNGNYIDLPARCFFDLRTQLTAAFRTRIGT